MRERNQRSEEGTGRERSKDDNKLLRAKRTWLNVDITTT